MCLIVALFQVVPNYPLVIGANRDERYVRQGLAPRVWEHHPKIFAGADPQAGGTWLGVNTSGLICALSNRHPDSRAHPWRRSRGLLCLDALGGADVEAALHIVRRNLQSQKYNPFNLLCGDAKRLVAVYHAPDGNREEEIGPGIHVLATGDVDDRSQRKVLRAHIIAAEFKPPKNLETAVDMLKVICRDHTDGPSEESLCMHGRNSGTVSSSIVGITQERTLACYWHVQSAPCKNEYQPAIHA